MPSCVSGKSGAAGIRDRWNAKAENRCQHPWRQVDDYPHSQPFSTLIRQSPNWPFPHFQTCRSGRLIVRLPYSARFGTRHRMLTYSSVPQSPHGNSGSCTGWSGEQTCRRSLAKKVTRRRHRLHHSSTTMLSAAAFRSVRGGLNGWCLMGSIRSGMSGTLREHVKSARPTAHDIVDLRIRGC